MTVTPDPNERWFLPDEPVKDEAHDEFSHGDVAKNLREMVREKSASPIIGLLGPFGVGKSSVVELLAFQLKGSEELAVIRVSAERHSEPTGLHRTLLYAVGEALQNSDPPLREAKDVARIRSETEWADGLVVMQDPHGKQRSLSDRIKSGGLCRLLFGCGPKTRRMVDADFWIRSRSFDQALLSSWHCFNQTQWSAFELSRESRHRVRDSLQLTLRAQLAVPASLSKN
jgi:hypothetical protein